MSRLAYDRLGSGPPLVLLHPLGADRRVWAPVLEDLAAQREVLAVDLPGFGESPVLECRPDPPALARAVSALLSTLGIERPNVAGNSLGGWVALELALSGGARTVTGIAPAGLWPQPLMPKRGLARSFARAALPVIDPLASTAFGRRLLLSGTMARPDLVPASAAAGLVRAYATAPGFRQANDAMRAGRFVALDAIAVPVTLAWPERDRLVTRPERLPECVVNRALPGCGHIPMWDDPKEVTRILLEGSAEQM
jgi:pimeloyl-ACP methyl ester carboxylesterase